MRDWIVVLSTVVGIFVIGLLALYGWQAIDEKNTPDDIAMQICKTYVKNPDQAMRRVAHYSKRGATDKQLEEASTGEDKGLPGYSCFNTNLGPGGDFGTLTETVYLQLIPPNGLPRTGYGDWVFEFERVDRSLPWRLVNMSIGF